MVDFSSGLHSENKYYKVEKYAFINTKGERMEGIPIMKQRKPHYYHKPYMLMFLPTLGMIASNHLLTGQAVKLWLYLLSHMEMGNKVHIPQTQMAADLDMCPSQVSKHIKTLTSMGLLNKLERYKTGYNYQIPIDVCWRGAGYKYWEARAKAIGY